MVIDKPSLDYLIVDKDDLKSLPNRQKLVRPPEGYVAKYNPEERTYYIYPKPPNGFKLEFYPPYKDYVHIRNSNSSIHPITRNNVTVIPTNETENLEEQIFKA